jgi:WD40 repeat protein/pimeloyl-ACP methyl ester carboxylesterase
LREGRPGRPEPGEVPTDTLSPTTSRESRQLSVGSKFSDWARRRSLTPNGARTTDLRQPSPSASQRRPSPSPGPTPRTLGRLGLHVVHQPGTTPLLDIIFIHGLGGDSEKTWSKDTRDPNLFWPQHWLQFEPEIARARILSFGYNASFLPGAPRSIYNIGDFAKELLYEMKFGKDDDGEDMDIGKVPIIFVVHSMGGLVAKKAYLLGQNDDTYKDIIHSVSAMVFLATPHRGTNLAEALSRLLTALFQPSRDFIADLNKSSPALEELNEQFRHIAPKLSIWSFYETLATQVGPMKLMVLDKNSSILGYTKEISRPLDADHHNICKYSSPDDSNYVSVRNALSSLAKRFRSQGMAAIGTGMPEEAKDLEKLLAVSSVPEEDLSFRRRLWIPGTCDWLLHEPGIRSWLETKQESCVTWFCAPPGSGKSTLSAHIISHLHDTGAVCQYFFFRFDKRNNRSLNTFLRSIAYQIAKDIPAYKRSLIDLSAEGLKLEKADSTLIWKKLYESILFAMELAVPLYWVVDALDESESPKALVELLQGVTSSQAPLRILIMSRKTEPLSLAFGRLASSLPLEQIEKDGSDFNSIDIHMLVEKEIKHMRGSDELKRQVAQDIENRAQGSFLWTRLVLEEIVKCHSEDAIQRTLNNIPSTMSSLYRRMELTILNNPRKADTALAKALLQWAIFSSRLLNLQELSQALRPEFPEMLDLRRTIQDICGQFIIINTTGQVTIVHQSARDYLVTNANNERLIDPRKAHEELFTKSVSVLGDANLRHKLTYGQHALRSTEPFLFYAATSWMYHLRSTMAASDEALDELIKLFKNMSVLIWIHALALVGELELLVKTAKVLATFVSNRRKLNLTKNPLIHRLSDIDLLERWAVDLIKLAGKFSRQLLSDPSAIYKLIPPLCPQYSILHQQFHQPHSAEVTIRGIANTSWSDNLAKIDLPNADQAWNVTSAAESIAVLGSIGTIYIWNSSNFTETCTLRHQEPVTAFCLNKKGNKLVTYGMHNTKFWSIPSGRLLSCTPNPAGSKAMSIIFTENDTKVVMGSKDSVIWYLHTKDLETGWQIVNPNLLKESSQIEGTIVSSPICMAFNGTGTQIGVSYRGFPLSVWALNEGYCIGRCKRAKAFRNDHGRPSTSWFAVDRFTWNPVSGHIIGLYKDGCVFKWHPTTDENQEAQSAADEIAASPDGKLFVTSNSDGTVRVWNFAYFTVIYQLSSADLVTGLAFSPDCRRFYDLRGCSVNAWEPNSLIRFSETEESFSDAGSEDQSPTSISHTSEASLAQYTAVTVVSAAAGSTWYCVGNEEGEVDLFDTRTDTVIELFRFLNFLGVSQIAWSRDATHVAAADLGGDIFVKRLVTSPVGANSKTELKSLAAPKVDLEGRGIYQMLFNDDSTLLLIISEDRGNIWSLNDKAVIATVTFDQDVNRRWLQHPTQTSIFLGFGASDIRVFRWQDFSEHSRRRFQEDHPQLDSHTKSNSTEDHTLDLNRLSLGTNGKHESNFVVNKAMLTSDSRHILVQTKGISRQGRIVKQVLIIDVSSLDTDGEGDAASAAVPHAYISPEILPRIEIPLGILSGSRLAFLDQDLWYCTFKLKSTQDHDEALKRHYFVPRDWTSTESVEHCCVTADGSLLCPKENRVAIISCNLESVGF